MIKSKRAAVLFLQRFERISELVGESTEGISDDLPSVEKAALAKPVGELLGSIVCDIYYPIIAEHPELRPVALLGKLRPSARYKVQHCKTIHAPIETLKENIFPDDANAVLAELRSAGPQRDGMFWLELQ